MSELFGPKIRHLRQRRGLTQMQIARQPDVTSQTHLTEMENGKTTVSLLQVVRLGQFFGVTTDYLLRDSIPVEAVEFVSTAEIAVPQAMIGKAQLKAIFAARLHALREQRGLSQLQLAQAVGLKQQSSISNMEAGRRLPSLTLVVRLADFFGVPTDALLRGETEEIGH